MKYLKLLIILSVPFLFSCEDDEAANPSIVGEWALSSLEYSTYSKTTAYGITLELEGEGLGYDMDTQINFTTDPNEFTTSGEYSVELTYGFQGQTATEKIEDIPFVAEGTWEVKDNVVTMTVDGETEEMTVTSLTESEIILHYVATKVISRPGEVVEASVDAIFTFTR